MHIVKLVLSSCQPSKLKIPLNILVVLQYSWSYKTVSSLEVCFVAIQMFEQFLLVVILLFKCLNNSHWLFYYYSNVWTILIGRFKVVHSYIWMTFCLWSFGQYPLCLTLGALYFQSHSFICLDHWLP